MARRGVVYLKWGNRLDPLLARSVTSLKVFHPELPVHVAELPEGTDVLAKARAMELSPFEETLFLDVDTVVLGNLDFGFESARRFALACCISECPWARRYNGLASAGDIIEYNTGVLFFTRAAKPVFDGWQQAIRTVDSTAHFYAGNQVQSGFNDQAAFAYAIASLGACPFVLPPNYNLRPTWQRSFFGPVKVWHAYEDPPASVIEFSTAQEQAGAIIQFAKLE